MNLDKKPGVSLPEAFTPSLLPYKEAAIHTGKH